MDHTISQSMGMKKVESTFLSPAQFPRKICEGIIQQQSDVCGKDTAYGL